MQVAALQPRRQHTGSDCVQGSAHANASVTNMALWITGSGPVQTPIGADPPIRPDGPAVRVVGTNGFLEQAHVTCLCGTPHEDFATVVVPAQGQRKGD